MATVDFIAYGEREAMVAEVAAFDMTASEGFDGDPARYAFLVMPVGDAVWDTEECSTLEEAREHARYLASEYGVSFYRY